MNLSRIHPLIAVGLIAFGPTACGQTEPGQQADIPSPADTVAQEPSQPGVVEVSAVDYAFHMPTQIPSGWTTFRMRNEGEEPHFMTLWKLPEGKTFQDYSSEIASVFVMAYDSLEAGAVDAAGANEILSRELPAWMAEYLPMGGPGLLSPGRSVETTVNLEPGTYVAECYIKTAEGEFHGELGMISELTVTADSTRMAEPAADLEMTLTNASIGTEGPVSAGEHTIAVHYQEHPAGLGNDVHVVRLDEGTDLAQVAAWMDWMNLEGFMPPAPAEFVGGVHEMPVGSTSYFTVRFDPGRYAWVSEATATDRQVREFAVE